jgi:hypothetical protein
MKFILAKGTVCYSSEVGVYNFYYPNFENKYEIRVPTEVQYMSWIGTQDYVAVKILYPSPHLPFSILWVKKDLYVT